MESSDKLLEAIDFEINNLLRKEKRPGWSLWALWSAFVAVIWLLSVKIPNVGEFPAYLILPAFLLYDFIQLSLNIIQSGFEETRTGIRFRLSHQSISNRIPFLIRIARYGALIVLLIDSSLTWHRYILWPYFILIILLTLLVIVLSYLKLPLLESHSPYPNIARIIFFIPTVLLLYISISLLISFDQLPSLPEIQLVGLVIVAYIILVRVARQESIPPMLDSLIELRRDLVFDRITDEAATKQLEKIVLGLKASDIIQEQYSEVIGLIEDANRVCKTLSDEVDKLEMQIESDQEDSTLENALRNSIDANLDRYEYIIDNIKVAVNKYKRRKALIQPAGGEVEEYLKELDETLINDSEEMKNKLSELTEKVKANIKSASQDEQVD